MEGFNPRAPCGARPAVLVELAFISNVSIHAPRVGRDSGDCSAGRGGVSFNPRAPCGARLDISIRARRRDGVSIHAPRVGRDRRVSRRTRESGGFNPRAPCGARPPMACYTSLIQRFNPRAPCGARLNCVGCSTSSKVFQSTRPVWGATEAVEVPRFEVEVSIHAPRVGRDSRRACA